MAGVRPGWFVTLCAASMAVSAFLPWLTTSANGGGRSSAVGSVVGDIGVPRPGFGAGQLILVLAAVLTVAGAMAARGLSVRLASTAAFAISVLLVVLTLFYYRLYVHPPVAAGYGIYLGGVVSGIAVVLSVWTMMAAWAESSRAS